MKDKILFQRPLIADQLLLEEAAESNRLVSTPLEKKAEQVWEDLQAQVKSEGRQMWDSLVYRLDDFSESDNKLKLRLSTIPFSIRMAFNDLSAELTTLGEAYYPKAIFLSCYVETRDGQYIFIEKSGAYHARRQRSFIGGIFSKDDTRALTPQALFSHVEKEVVEELAQEVKVEDLYLLGAYQNRTGNVCMMFHASLPATSQELSAGFQPGEKAEAKGLLFTSRQELAAFVLDKVGFEKSAVQLYGKRKA